MAGASGSLTVTVGARDQTKAALDSATSAALRFANAELEAAKKAEEASGKTTRAKSAQVSAAKQVALAVQQQINASDPLKSRLVELQRAHAELTARMQGMVKAGQPIPPSMARAAAEAQKAATAIKAQGRASQGAAGQISGLQNSLYGMAASYASLALVVPRVVGGLKEIAVNQIVLGEELNKTSIKLGIGIESLQELRFAAESAGVTNEQMNTTLRFLNKAIGEAAIGTKSYTDAFDQLGVTVFDSEGRLKNLDEILPEIADGMMGTADQGTRVALSMRLMGRSGSDLLPILQGGSAGLASMRQQARELGGVMSTDAALAADKAMQSFTDFEFAVTGLKNKIGAALTPAINGVTTALVALAKEAERDKAAFEELVAIGLSVLTAGLSDSVTAASKLIGKTKEEIETEKKLSEQRRADAAEQQSRARLDAAETRKREARIKELAAAQEAAAKKEARDVEEAERRKRIAAEKTAEARKRFIDETAAWITRKRIKEINDQLALEESIAIASDKKNQERMENERKAVADALAADRQRIQSATAAAQQIGTQFGNMFVALAQGGEESEKVVARTFLNMGKQAIDTALQMIMAEVAKGSAAAISAHAGIPFVGVALGLAAASAVASAILSFVNFAEGGIVTGGTPGKDSVPAMLMPGEMVIPADITAGLLKAARQPGGTHTMAAGGIVKAGGTAQIVVHHAPTFQLLEVPNSAQVQRMVRDSFFPVIGDLNRLGYK